MSQHDLTALSKNRVRKTFGTCVSNHEVGPKRNESHKISSMKLAAKMHRDVNVARRFPANRASPGLVDMAMHAKLSS